MNQSQIAPIGLLEPYQDLAKAVHPRMAGFHNPSSRAVTWIRRFFLPLLTARSDVRSIAPVFHRRTRLATVKALVSTQVLRLFRCGLWASHHNTVQNHLHLSDVMTVGPRDDDGERGTSAVHQDMSLGPFFSPDLSDWLRRTPLREGLCSLHHPYFASPRQSPATRHNPSNRPAREPGRTRLGPTPGSSGGWRWHNRIALVGEPSTDNLSVAHTQCLQKPAGMATACARHQGLVCIPCADLEKAAESKVAPSPIKHPKRPMTESCPMHTSGYRVPEITCIKKYKMSRALLLEVPPTLHPTVSLLNHGLVCG